MSELLSGYRNFQYVEQPPGSEQCFAAIVSAVSGAELHESQAALYQGGFVDEDGGTGMFWMETDLEVAGEHVEIVPLEAPAAPEKAEEVQKFMELLDQQFAEGKAVALLYKKTGDIEDARYHWMLLTGSRSTDGAIHVMDPLRDPEEQVEPGEETRYVSRTLIADLVRQSTDYREASDGQIKAAGIFPHAISTSSSSPPQTPQQLLVKFE